MHIRNDRRETPVIEPERYDLDNAYQIETPQDAARLYGDWASTYDGSFAEAWGYVAPREIAAIFREHAGADDTPILDVGAGTGLVATALGELTIDAVDISEEMLAVAGGKGLYRERIVADLTQPLAIADDRYGGVVSCGAFTHGHVGPECLPELLRVTRPGALFCVGTIAPVFDGAGFGSAFALLVAARRITPLQFRDIPVYEGADHPHVDDRGLVAIFRTR